MVKTFPFGIKKYKSKYIRTLLGTEHCHLLSVSLVSCFTVRFSVSCLLCSLSCDCLMCLTCVSLLHLCLILFSCESNQSFLFQLTSFIFQCLHLGPVLLLPWYYWVKKKSCSKMNWPYLGEASFLIFLCCMWKNWKAEYVFYGCCLLFCVCGPIGSYDYDVEDKKNKGNAGRQDRNKQNMIWYNFYILIWSKVRVRLSL